MATLTNTKIKDTYDGLLKTTDNQAIDASGVTLIEDGLGNASALSVGRSGNGVTITGSLSATLSTAAQPNITSVGTLSSLAVSGNLTVDTNTLYVDAASNSVGIGESSPSRPIHITADTPAIRLEDSTGSDYSELVSVNGDLYIRADEGNTEANSTIRFQIDQSEKIRIDSSGNVGIGSTNPSDKLVVIGDIASTSSLKLTGNSSTPAAGAFVHRPASNELALGTNSAERMRIDSSGNVGIGISSPSSRGFQINKASADSGLVITRTGTGAAEFQQFIDSSGNIRFNNTSSTASIFYTANTERMRIDSAGNIGIGESNPLGDLHIKSEDTGVSSVSAQGSNLVIEGNENGMSILSSTAGAGYINFGDSDDNNVGMIIYGHSSNSMSFWTNAGKRMTIDASGNVGIGTSSPDGLLNLKHTSSSGAVADDASAYALTLDFTGNTNDFGRHIAIRDAGGRAVASMGGIDQGGLGATGLYFATGDVNAITERMRITNGGDVLIGKTATTLATDGVRLSSTGMNLSRTSATVFDINRNGTDGNAIAFYKNGTNVGVISVTGSNTSYVTSSDYRLKENVVPMEGALDRVDALKPSRFNFIADPEKTVDGFLAHEVADVVPEAITGEKDAVDEEGNPIYQGIDQSKIVPLLVGAIQELRAEIELLKNK